MWRKQHPDVPPQIDANRLANVRRDIIKNHRLSETELNTIKERVRSKVSNIDENCCMTNIYGNINKPFHEISNVSQQKHHEVLNDVEIAGLESPEVIQTNYFNDELVNSIRDKILQKWAILKEESIEKRNALPKIRIDYKVKQLINVTNQALNYIKEHRVLDITDVNQLIYASPLVICKELGLKAWTTKTKYENTPAWKKQIEQKIQEKRSDLSILTEIMKGSFVKDKKRKQLERKFNFKTKEDLCIVIETLKQQIQAKAQKMRRLEKRNRFFRQNKLFREDAKKFYRELGKKQITVKCPPAIEQIQSFWGEIWEKNDRHNENAYWIKQQEDTYTDVEQQEWLEINAEETSNAIKKTSNWKAPGIDKVANFWIKALTSLHENMTTAFCDILIHPHKCPAWLTTGITFLLPKDGDTSNPKNFRPITCLPTMYKILTSILTDGIYAFLDKNNILPPEQKGCRKESYGCKDQLLINKMIIEEVKSKKKNLSTA